MTMSDEELKNRLDSIIDYCEELAQWIGKARGDDITLDGLLQAMYEEAVNMSRIAVNARLAIAKTRGRFGDKKDKEAE